MSSRCQCPYSGPADTILGCHRDPITSEKGWLDFAVRELSRVAAGKAKGQEAVWRSQCKPAWWDCVCPHPWKNPTANPKDSKDTLKVKFECLVQHLRKKEQLPKEMEEEISLWEADKKPEVFLMTSFSSLLGQASNLHTMVQDTCKKMEETGMSVAPCIITDLQRCLSNCANKLDTIKNMTDKNSMKDNITKPGSHTVSKRPREEMGDVSEPQSKRSKYTSLSSLSSSQSPSPARIPSLTPSTSPPPSQTLSQTVSNTTISSEQSKVILAFLQKQLLQKKCSERGGLESLACKTNTAKSNTNPVQARRKQIGKKMKVGGMGQGNVSAGSSTGLSPTVCLPATVSHSSVPEITEENSEFQDFLELDLPDNELIDCQFVDSLLETSPAPSVNVSAIDTVNTNTPGSLAQHSCQGTVVNSDVTYKPSDSKCDPFLSHTGMTCDISENNLFLFDVSQGEADRQVVTGNMEGDVGTVFLSGVGNIETCFGDTDVISDSGYNSESSVTASHRSSTDSDHYSYSDLNSPDLEAYLNSLE